MSDGGLERFDVERFGHESQARSVDPSSRTEVAGQDQLRTVAHQPLLVQGCEQASAEHVGQVQIEEEQVRFITADRMS